MAVPFQSVGSMKNFASGLLKIQDDARCCRLLHPLEEVTQPDKNVTSERKGGGRKGGRGRAVKI